MQCWRMFTPYCINSGGGTQNFDHFLNVVVTLFLSKLQEFIYKPVYVFIYSDGKASLTTNEIASNEAINIVLHTRVLCVAAATVVKMCTYCFGFYVHD